MDEGHLPHLRKSLVYLPRGGKPSPEQNPPQCRGKGELQGLAITFMYLSQRLLVATCDASGELFNLKVFLLEMSRKENEALSLAPHPTSGPADVQPASGAPISSKPLFSGREQGQPHKGGKCWDMSILPRPATASPLLAAEHRQADRARLAAGKGGPNHPACPSHHSPVQQRDAPGCPLSPRRGRAARGLQPRRVPARGRKWPPGARSRRRCGRCRLPPPSPATPRRPERSRQLLGAGFHGDSGGGRGRPWRRGGRGDVCRDVRGVWGRGEMAGGSGRGRRRGGGGVNPSLGRKRPCRRARGAAGGSAGSLAPGHLRPPAPFRRGGYRLS